MDVVGLMAAACGRKGGWMVVGVAGWSFSWGSSWVGVS